MNHALEPPPQLPDWFIILAALIVLAGGLVSLFVLVLG